MRRELLSLLQCPGCRGAVDYQPSAGDDDHQGDLRCGCGAVYPVREGIADLTLPGHHLDVAMAHAWSDVQDSSALVTDRPSLLDYERYFRDTPASEAHRYSYGMLLNFDLALARMGLGPGMSVLDVGAGMTWTTWHLARTGAHAVAVDLLTDRWAGLACGADYMAAHAVTYDRIRAPMDRLPFGDASFDRVLFHAALHHAEDLAGTLEETHRVLKPGGRVHLVNEPTGSLLGLFDGRFTATMAASGEHVHSAWAYRRALAQTGLRPRLLFAPGVAARLDALAAIDSPWRPTTRGQAIKYAAVRIGLDLWRRSAGFRRAFERVLYFPALCLFGQFLVAEGDKPIGS